MTLDIFYLNGLSTTVVVFSFKFLIFIFFQDILATYKIRIRVSIVSHVHNILLSFLFRFCHFALLEDGMQQKTK